MRMLHTLPGKSTAQYLVLAGTLQFALLATAGSLILQVAALILVVAGCQFFSSQRWPSALTLLICAFGLLPFVVTDSRILAEAALVVSVLFSFRARWPLIIYDGMPILNLIRGPLILVACSWILALIQGQLLAGNQFALDDARRYLAFLAVLPFATIARRNVDALWSLIVLISKISVVLLVLQMALNVQFLGLGKATQLGGAGEGFESLVRGSADGGNYLAVFLLFYSLTLASQKAAPSVFLLRMSWLALSGVAVASTYSRGIWLGVVAAFAWYLILNGRSAGRLATSAVVAGVTFAALSLGALLLAPDRVAALSSRIHSIAVEREAGTSVGARLEENLQAIESIESSPFVGLGHGGEYKRTDLQVERGFTNEVTFIHNAYLWILVKLGLFGVIGYLLLIGKMFKLAGSALRSDHWNQRTYGLASSCTLVAFLVSGLSSPVWAQFSDLVAILGIMVGLAGLRFQACARP